MTATTTAADAAIELAELARRYGTDKGPDSITRSSRLGRKHTLAGKNYTATYGQFFAELRDKPIRFLEIGIDRGASIPVWEDFFSNAHLAAIDIKPECAKYGTARTTVHVGSQTDPTFLRRVHDQSGPFDVVIDDGGHTMEQNQVSLVTLWPLLKRGGLYVIEDLHSSYRKEFGGSYLGPETTVEKLKNLIDSFHTVHFSQPILTPVIDQIAGIWIAPAIAVLRKEA